MLKMHLPVSKEHRHNQRNLSKETGIKRKLFGSSSFRDDVKHTFLKIVHRILKMMPKVNALKITTDIK